jgi:prepilin-type processing-associated H-X9-DG protein
MKGITLWQKYANFWQIISKKIREMGSYLITYCCHPPTRKVNDSSSSVNICFVDAHVEMRKRSEIPTASTNVF